MKIVLGLAVLALGFGWPAAMFAQTPTLSCRPLDQANTYVGPDEKVIGDQACKVVATSATVKQPAAANELAATTKNEAIPTPPTSRTDETPAAVPSACLIVASAEGHRFRDSMIAGALTGGIGFAAGAIVGGAKYAYRDSFNLPPDEIKVKYKGKQLQKIEQSGVHVIVINAKDKTGSEIDSARKSCRMP